MKIYQTHREIHMIGDYVAVCWNTKQEKRTIKGEDGLTYDAKVNVRCHGPYDRPYIDFVTVLETDEGCYEDDDSPVDGGISANAAEQIAQELIEAAAYLREQIKS